MSQAALLIIGFALGLVVGLYAVLFCLERALARIEHIIEQVKP